MLNSWIAELSARVKKESTASDVNLRFLWIHVIFFLHLHGLGSGVECIADLNAEKNETLKHTEMFINYFIRNNDSSDFVNVKLELSFLR